MRNFKYLILIILFSCTSKQDQILKIGLVANLFCLENTKYSKIFIHKAIGLNTTGQALAKPTECMGKNNKKIEGDFFLKSILKNIKFEKELPKIEIYLINIFEKNNNSFLESLNKLIEFAEKEKLDFIVSQHGFIVDEKSINFKKNILKNITFVQTTAIKNYPILENTLLWPQVLNNNYNQYFLSHAIEPSYVPKDGKSYGMFDYEILYKYLVSYLKVLNKDQNDKEMTVVSSFLGLIINSCAFEAVKSDKNELKKCVDQRTRELQILNTKTPTVLKSFI